MPESLPNIVVIGAGPAGAATALGLKGLGYPVSCLYQPRKPSVHEGISERVFGALDSLGVQNALRAVSPPVPRSVTWGGVANSANVERIVDRDRFDLGLIQDLVAAGIEVKEATVRLTQWDGVRWHIGLGDGDEITADFLVEARGRRAPNGQGTSTKGPISLSLGQYWRTNGRCSWESVRVGSLPEGWYWIAPTIDGRLFTQISLSGERTGLPSRDGGTQFIVDTLTPLAPFNDDMFANPIGTAHYRGSTPTLHGSPCNEKLIRVGDAAMAVDPLSGNGIFQSLSSALVAPAVVNTLMTRPERGDLARRFYTSRLEHLFYRFSRIGRDFYRDTDVQHRFWEARRHWPDNRAAHANTNGIVGVATRPVVNQGYIESRDVVITHDQPLGIWRIGDRDAVEVIEERHGALPRVD